MQAEGWSCHELTHVGDSSIDIAADVVGVVIVHRLGVHRVAGDDPISEARCESLDLRFDAVGHLDSRAVWYVTVGPDRFGASRGAVAVEQALLSEQHVWALGVATFWTSPSARTISSSLPPT